jgi:N6-adenosine-specific RNA methylase IME4/ParB-like chromosome segregation protein Spo0J
VSPTNVSAWASAAPTVEVRVELRPVAALRQHPQRGTLIPPMDERPFRTFVDDITHRGILTPLELDDDDQILDGHERHRAAVELRLEKVPVVVVAPADPVEYMLRAALERRHLSASQRAALAIELDSYQHLRDEAEQRRLANLRQNQDNTEMAELPPRPKTREIAAEQAGVSPRTIQDAATVREHDPDLFEEIKAGKIAADQAARRVRRRLRDSQLPPPPPPPEGPCELIYADPPWQLGHPDSRHAPENHYPCMPLDQIKALTIPADDNSILLLWAVNQLLPDALEVMAGWGFGYVANLAWVKPTIGLGVWTRNRHELLLVGRRGTISPPDADQRPDSVIEAQRGRHSAKPEAVYQLIETAYPHLSKLELFHRGQPRPGWTTWGNQSNAAPGDTKAEAA